MLKQPLHSMRRRALGRATAIALLLATGYAAWAAQPAKPSISTVPAGKIAAEMTLRVDEGDPIPLRAVADAGVPFSIDARHDGKNYLLALTVERAEMQGKPILKVQVRISEDGKLLSEPSIAVVSGGEASIQIDNRPRHEKDSAAFQGVRLDIRLTDSMPVALHAAKPSPASASAASSKSKPIPARQAMASTTGNFNTYERMLTSISASWQPPKPVEDGC